MFSDRAGLVSPRFDAGRRTRHRGRCKQVDHIPLAIELAAAWVRALSPKQIAAGLVDSFRLLAGGPRHGVDRHQTLLASMDWSHALLAEDEDGSSGGWPSSPALSPSMRQAAMSLVR